MKKFLAVLIALMMVLSLAACGGGDDDTPSGNEDNSVASQSDEGFLNREEDKGKLWDIADSDITILDDGQNISIVPAELKKGIGDETKAQISLNNAGSLAGSYTSRFTAYYEEVSQLDVDALIDHLELAFGVEASEGGLSSIYTDYIIYIDGMDLTVSHYTDDNEVKITAYLK